MKYLNIYQSVSKVTCSALLCVGVLTASFSTQAAVEFLQPSQKPLSLTEGVPPNLLVTLDDSGSMAWAYTPDAISGRSNLRAGRSNTYNANYYDPNALYVTPKKVSYSGGEIKIDDYTYGAGKDINFYNAPKDGFAGTGHTNLSDKYQVQWGNNSFLSGCYTIYPAGVCDSGNTPAHYFEYKPSGACPLAPDVSRDNDCYEYKEIQTDAEKKNFAIWYSFYRNRNLATRTAANLAFYTMPDNVRLTWGALNSCHIGTNSSGNCNSNEMGRFTGQHRVNFFKWLDTFPASGGTPLHRAMHRAGEFVKNDTADKSVCRSSYHVLMTDGMWNSRANSKGNTDSTSKALPDGKQYTGQIAPYWDGQTLASTADTLADSAFYYWSNDLRGDLDNDIAPYMPIKTADPLKDYWDPRNNPATWQHMVNFTVGLGLSNSLRLNNAPTWDVTSSSPTFAHIDQLKNLGTNGLAWPGVTADSASTIYDLWHAAINSRGEFFSADSPDSLVQAFKQILERISGRSTTGSSPAVNSGVGDDGTGYAYQASYASDQNWAGNLTATKKTVDAFGNLTTTQIWSAKEKLDVKAISSRNIKMAKPSGSGFVDFKWPNLSESQQKDLNRDPERGDITEVEPNEHGADRLSFLRGDRTKEGSLFRERISVLGDLVNSKPVTVRGARYLTGHANRIEGTDKKYEDFVIAHKNRTPMVYVGANDGMLHGFNADTGDEVFAFVPSAVFKNLHKLTGTGYGDATHQFFVDGSPVVADAFINDKWRTVLVGTLGAGGKGMFALDVTDPADITLLWEFNEDKLAADGFDVKLGYTYSQPTIARLHNGKWAAVVGNGYAAAGSDNGKAALLIIDMETGNLTKELVVEGVAGVPNGMSTPRLADINGDGIADYAYSGDLQGNVWRFDLAPNNGDADNPFMRKRDPRDGETVQFQASFAGNPLYVALDSDGNRQPITAAPSIVRHPTGNGYIIVAGTGRFYAEGDQNGLADSKQSIYGVWDPTTKVARSTGKGGFPFAAAGRTNLQEQTMQSALYAVSNGREARLLSDNPVLWAEKTESGWLKSKDSKPLMAGWYFDLVLNKEMIVADMLQFGRTLYFQSLVPNTNPCASGVENWSYAINPSTGGRTQHHAWTDYRNLGSPNTVITAVRMGGEGGLTIGQRPDKKFELCTGITCEEITPDPASIGRQSWRVVEGQ